MIADNDCEDICRQYGDCSEDDNSAECVDECRDLSVGNPSLYQSLSDCTEAHVAGGRCDLDAAALCLRGGGGTVSLETCATLCTHLTDCDLTASYDNCFDECGRALEGSGTEIAIVATCAQTHLGNGRCGEDAYSECIEGGGR